MRSKRPRLRLLFASAFVLALAAGPSHAQGADRGDPWEPFNRKVYSFNRGLDRWVIAPVAHGYARVLPRPLRAGLRNFSRNLGEPLIVVNDLLQGHPGTAAATLGRFTINTTLGLAGVFDVAGRTGIPHHDNGFGTTLGRWGLSPGPYLFLPIAGPSSVRDALGSVVNIFLSPQYYVNDIIPRPVGLGTFVVNGLEARLDAQQTLDTIDQTSTDPYATLRSYFQQNREAQIHGETSPAALPDFDAPDAPEPQPQPESQSQPEPQPEPQQPPAAPAPDAGAQPHVERGPEPAATSQELAFAAMAPFY
jgi:phospholipid-binding lipoprotein MlaA